MERPVLRGMEECVEMTSESPNVDGGDIILYDDWLPTFYLLVRRQNGPFAGWDER